jgi:hypothetical protein
VDFPIDCNTRLFEITRNNRLSVVGGLKPEAINRSMAVTKALREAGRSIMMIERGWTSLAMTNWCSAWRGTDFSPVVVKREMAKAEDSGGQTNGHAVAPGTTQVNGEAAHVNGEVTQADGEAASESSATDDAPTEPAGTAEGALRTKPDIPTAKPIVLGHSLQRHIKISRCKPFKTTSPNIFSTNGAIDNCQVMSYEQGGFWVDFSCSTKNMPLVDALLKKDPFLETI